MAEAEAERARIPRNAAKPETIWRAVAAASRYQPEVLGTLDLEELASRIVSNRAQLSRSRLYLPTADALRNLFNALGSERLKTILERHLSAEGAGRFGTPDLFLYACKIDTDDLAFFRFVEVKRPGERVSDDQREEIAFLRNLGLPARVLRLIERT